MFMYCSNLKRPGLPKTRFSYNSDTALVFVLVAANEKGQRDSVEEVHTGKRSENE